LTQLERRLPKKIKNNFKKMKNDLKKKYGRRPPF
jgi:hypothetical protein